MLRVWQVLTLAALLVAPWSSAAAETELDASLAVMAPTSETIDNELCRRQALLYAASVRTGDAWAVTMYEAGTKEPFSSKAEDGFHLGQYEKCLSLEMIPTAQGSITGRHCLVAMGDATWTTHESFYGRLFTHVAHLEEQLRATEGGEVITNEGAKRGLVWSLCVPASCSPRDVKLHLLSTLRVANSSNDNTSMSVDRVNCFSRADDISLTSRDWILISIIATILIMSAVGTWNDFFPITTRDYPRSVLDAFSLRSGARQLFTVSSVTQSTVNYRLPALDGIRVLSMMKLFLYHQQVITDHTPPVRELNFADDLWLQRSRYTINLHVDTFILLSGLLVCFNHLRDQQKDVKFKLLDFYIQRLVRVGPLLWLGILFMQSNLQFLLTESPLVLANIREQKMHCSDFLHQHLLFLGNYLPPEHMCPLHSWYVAVDLQLITIAPIFITLLHSNPSLGRAVVAFTLFLSLTLTYLLTSGQQASHYLGLPCGLNVRHTWFHPFTRLTPWLVGIGLGYVLHVTARSPVHMSKASVTAAWIVAAAMMLTALWMLPVVLSWGNENITLLLVNVYKPMWAVGVAWVIFACSRGFGGRVSSLLSWRGFLVPSRLAYCFYLSHVPVVAYFANNVSTIQQATMATRWINLLRDLVTSFAVAMVAHLVVELPAINLRKVLRRDGSSHVKASTQKEE